MKRLKFYRVSFKWRDAKCWQIVYEGEDFKMACLTYETYLKLGEVSLERI